MELLENCSASKMISTFRHHNCSNIPPETDIVISFTPKEFWEFSDSSQETETKNRCWSPNNMPRICFSCASTISKYLPVASWNKLHLLNRAIFGCKFQESFGFIPWSLTGVGVAGGSIWRPSRKACIFNLDSWRSNKKTHLTNVWLYRIDWWLQTRQTYPKSPPSMELMIHLFPHESPGLFPKHGHWSWEWRLQKWDDHSFFFEKGTSCHYR